MRNVDFYSSLFSSEDINDLLSHVHTKLSPAEIKSCEGDLLSDELTQSIKGMAQQVAWAPGPFCRILFNVLEPLRSFPHECNECILGKWRPSFCKWIATMHNGALRRILISGFLSDKVALSRGVR